MNGRLWWRQYTFEHFYFFNDPYMRKPQRVSSILFAHIPSSSALPLPASLARWPGQRSHLLGGVFRGGPQGGVRSHIQSSESTVSLVFYVSPMALCRNCCDSGFTLFKLFDGTNGLIRVMNALCHSRYSGARCCKPQTQTQPPKNPYLSQLVRSFP